MNYLTLFLLFSFVFNFNLPLINVPAIVIPVLFSSGFFMLTFRKNIGLTKIDKYILFFLCLLMVLLSISVIRSTFTYRVDISYVESLIKLPIYIFLSYLMAYWFVVKRINFTDTLVIVFFIQAVIIIVSLSIPETKDFFDLFKKISLVESSSRYGGLRGHAISSVIYFGLAIIYSLFFIYIASADYYKKNTLSKVLIVSVIFISTFTIARTAIIGFALSTIVLFFYQRHAFFMYVKVFVIMISPLLTYVLLQPGVSEIIINQLRFAFEFLFNYIEHGTLRTNSTDVLSIMYYPLEEFTYIYGDGQYMAQDGLHYYGSTDAGYMRNFLYFGMFSIFIYIGQIYFNFHFSKVLCSKFNHIPLFITITIFMSLIHFKGDVLFVAKPFYTLYFLIFFYHSLKSKVN